MKKDNKGFSLVELIVVITIIGILAAIVISSAAPLFSQRAASAASSANALLSKCKVFSMSREGDVYVRLYKAANGQILGEYWENGTLVSTEVIGSQSVQISPDNVYISFKRSTGGLRIFGSSLSSAAPGGGTSTVTFSTVGNVYDVEIVASTGKHEVIKR